MNSVQIVLPNGEQVLADVEVFRRLLTSSQGILSTISGARVRSAPKVDRATLKLISQIQNKDHTLI